MKKVDLKIKGGLHKSINDTVRLAIRDIQSSELECKDVECDVIHNEGTTSYYPKENIIFTNNSEYPWEVHSMIIYLTNTISTVMSIGPLTVKANDTLTLNYSGGKVLLDIK